MDADFVLIRKMKQGDEAAFDVFVRKYYGEIFTYCSYHCPDRTYAEDITQETFVRFFTKLSAYHYRGKTKNYLYTIAGNLCKDYLKKVKELSVEDVELDEKNRQQESSMEDVINKLTIEWALKQLPDDWREVVILYYFQELKLAEIAKTLQIGLPLVKYRLRKARNQLEELLRNEAGEKSVGGAFAKGGRR